MFFHEKYESHEKAPRPFLAGDCRIVDSFVIFVPFVDKK